MFFTILIALVIATVYGNIGYDLTSKEKAKSRLKGWDKFGKDWWWMMLYLPITTLANGVVKTALFPALRRHRKRISEVEAQKELDDEEYPKLLAEAKEGAERAAKGIPDPEPEQNSEPPSPLNEALKPKTLSPKPKKPSDK